MMVCPNCGNQVDAADKFCMACGQKLHGDGATSGAAAQGVPQQYYDGTTVVPVAMPGGANVGAPAAAMPGAAGAPQPGWRQPPSRAPYSGAPVPLPAMSANATSSGAALLTHLVPLACLVWLRSPVQPPTCHPKRTLMRIVAVL